MSEALPPIVDAGGLRALADGVWAIIDQRVPLVPNIGVVVGEDAALVVDTGIGNANGRVVLEAARRLAAGKPLILTLTHFHPEHGYGADAFKGAARIVYNKAQGDDLVRKGEAYLAMFRDMNAEVAAALEGTTIVAADELYRESTHTIDLGGKTVTLHALGPSHTRGDQIAFVNEDQILFAGDLAEERTFPIFPWFPPDDAEIDASGWARALEACLALKPKIVVPGHGDIGGPEILQAVRDYIAEVSTLVATAGELDTPALVAALRPKLLAAHPDWHFSEWIDFAIRYFDDTGARVA